MKNLFKHIKGDAFGGITAAIVALPLALAFGVQSGLGAAAGLYGAFLIGIFAAVFGGTCTQISGPTAPMTVVSAAFVATILAANNGNVEKSLPLILGVFILAGLFQIVLGVLRLGQYIKYVPYPVVSGFMTGIGVIILITQIFSVFGYQPTQDEELVTSFKADAEEVILENILKEEANEGVLVLEDFRETISRAEQISPDQIQTEAENLAKNDTGGVVGSLKYFGRAAKNINWLEFILVLSTIIIIYGFKKITKKIPSALVALIVITAVTLIFNLDVLIISDKGVIPSGFPALHFEVFTEFNLTAFIPYIATAAALAGLGAIDSLLTSVVADNVTKTKHNSNKELVGQGIGNSIAGLFGGIPGAGATIRTIVNIDAGGKTKVSGVIHGIVLLMIVLVLGPYASYIPLSVLAGILVTVGIGVMDYKGLKVIHKMPRTDAVVMITVLLLTVFLDLIIAVGIGLVLSALMFMKKMGDVTTDESRVESLQESNGEEPWIDELNFPKKFKEEVFIKHLNGPLFFGYTNDFQQTMSKIPKTANHIIIRMDKVPYIDQSGLFTLEDVLIDLLDKGVTPLIVGIKRQPLYRLRSIDIVPDLVPEDHLFETFKECVNWVKVNVKHEETELVAP
ncbi:STAS domain-containing protein [Leptobacterium flavescens]|uniref:STAS domain-containing protein n=1 Tax=Leptobacterium flavescens TaxID=472055 RepID=A0A6P0UM80_9FLAO|nr:SulP family inorganic anion transporter [Leptobacterium flavescens]NER14334.1 STAS domain-containing protein [Leptobacterium flavescens]